jgi:hypothetical protein
MSNFQRILYFFFLKLYRMYVVLYALCCLNIPLYSLGTQLCTLTLLVRATERATTVGLSKCRRYDGSVPKREYILSNNTS